MADLQPAKLPDDLLASGITSFTVDDAAKRTGRSAERVHELLKRLIDQGQVVSPARGFYVPVEPKDRSFGAPPAVEYVDAMMRHLDRRYYVALLSAAELHGIAHQRPQVFQVVIDRQLQGRRVGRTRLQFFTSGKLDRIPTTTRNTPSGVVQLSTIEATVLDLCFRPKASAGLDNVATIIGELVEDGRLDYDLLAEAAEPFPASAIRRAGWILEHLCGVTDFVDRLTPRDAEPTKLDPQGTRRGSIDRRWKVIENTDVVPDL